MPIFTQWTVNSRQRRPVLQGDAGTAGQPYHTIDIGVAVNKKTCLSW